MKKILILSTVFTLLLSCSPTGINDSARKGNHLKDEKSPYLLQHAHNPVDWYPWGQEALEKAEREKKLLIISIGYASCHWCHVMEKESFSDTAVSRVMNEHFVSIKVDREERPDIDNIYMTACQLATEGGCGWPLNAIALPNGKPVYAGTYFPKAEWMRLLEYFIQMNENEPEKLINFAEQLTQGIQQNEIKGLGNADTKWSSGALDSITEVFLSQIDFENGGKEGAPKFPLPNNFEFLLQHARLTENQASLQAVTTTLNEMARGGIYDQIGGGFARYSTDANWKVPHFEKMLYDNAQLISLYASAFKFTQDTFYKKIMDETLSFISRELSEQNGGYYSSIDADSEGEEGTFYVWSKDAFDSALKTEQYKRIGGDLYDIRPAGNWEKGKNILYQRLTPRELASKYKMELPEIEQEIQQINEALFKARAQRTRPHTDDKVLLSWNALMLKAFLDAYTATGTEQYLDKALANEAFISKYMVKEDGSLWRTYKDGEAGINAFLEDYALLIQAYIQLYQTTFVESHLRRAEDLTSYVIEKFEDEDGFFLFTSKDDPPLVANKKEISDNVIPSSNSVMARNLYAMGTLLYRQEWIDKSEKMLARVFPQIQEQKFPSYYSNWLQLTTNLVFPYYEIAIVGKDASSLNLEMQREYQPHALFLGGQDEGTLELLKDKLQEGETYIYVCRNKVCKLPVTESEKAATLMTVQ